MTVLGSQHQHAHTHPHSRAHAPPSAAGHGLHDMSVSRASWRRMRTPPPGEWVAVTAPYYSSRRYCRRAAVDPSFITDTVHLARTNNYQWTY